MVSLFQNNCADTKGKEPRFTDRNTDFSTANMKNSPACVPPAHVGVCFHVFVTKIQYFCSVLILR